MTTIVLSSCGSTAAPAARPMPGLTGDPRLLLTTGGGGGVQQLMLWDVRQGKALQTLPLGAISPDGRLLYALDLTSSTTLRAIDIRSNQTVGTLPIPEGFTPPQGGFAGSQSMGLSPNGGWIALQAFDRAGQNVTTRSRYLLVDTNFHSKPRMITLNGHWEFDGLSNDGQRLYLLEYVDRASGATSYQVRVYDFAANSLWPRVIVDKRLWGETMTGNRLMAVPSLDQTWLFSLYVFGPNGPFIHALSLDGATRLAWCVDLPNPATGDDIRELLWTLVRSTDGQRLYAVNAGEGVAAEISLSGDSPPVVSRTARFAVQQTSPTSFLGLVVNADAKRFLIGGAVLSTDGRTLYALGDNGIYALDTTTLKLRHQYLLDVPLDSVMQSLDGTTLFASSSQQNKIFRVDLDSGQSQVLTNAVEVNSLVGIETP